MNAKEYLRQIKVYDNRIQRKIDELDRLRALATGAGGSGMDPNKTISPDMLNWKKK